MYVILKILVNVVLPVINKDWVIIKIQPFNRKSINNFYLKAIL
jgi:hypothetical protein